ncbi:transposase [Wolbachia endosymbiont of Nasonia vitripennis]|uniref:transposase n=1 Tax=Wolbachia endosymbiont of Nasonia vitripennis TaxID=180837 RepID=UPI0039C66E25
MVLPSGEIEVLATSLMDEQKFQTGGFKELYFLRWRVETFFAKLKGRLSLENFTRKSVESVKQDFWSAIFISNLESVMTEDVEEALNVDLTDDKLKRSYLLPSNFFPRNPS